MDRLPVIELERINLRPFTLNDAKKVQTLAGDKAIAAVTLNIPHPYQDGMAEAWIKSHQEDFSSRKGLTLAIVHQQKGFLIGAIGLTINSLFKRGELGYWIGKQYWNNGYCTEAAQSILSFGFEKLCLNRIYACYLSNNPASGKVMSKLGMKFEGILREHVQKWEEFHDVVYYGILKKDFYKR